MTASIQRVTDMPTSIRLDADSEARLTALAKLTGRTKAFYLRELVERGLVDLEGYYLASETLNRVRKGEEATYSTDEVRKALNNDA
jgi:RHH-type transcriptional regulator, rel operon repressor / antitoxin RelB